MNCLKISKLTIIKENNLICTIYKKVLATKTSLRLHIKTIHERQKDYECVSCGNLSFNQDLWRNTTRQFTKGKEITNVILVENTSLHQIPWKNISRQSMKDKEITNVIIVENTLIMQEIWRITSRKFMKDKDDKNVILVKNHFHK